jgi:nicotinamide riboside kinase
MRTERSNIWEWLLFGIGSKEIFLFRNSMSIFNSNRILVVTGPECSGKTTLAARFSRQLNAKLVSEYSVEYLRDNGSNYDLSDIEKIGREQKKRIEFAALEKDLVVVDTACLVLKVWSEIRFGEVSDFIEKWWQESMHYQYYLCKPDLPWEAGPFRENPLDRNDLYEKYYLYLNNAQRSFVLVDALNRTIINPAQ